MMNLRQIYLETIGDCLDGEFSGPGKSELYKKEVRLDSLQTTAYDYIVNTFHSYLNDANQDSMGWSSIRVSIERVEASDWKDAKQMVDALKIIKAIGMMYLFGNGGFTLTAKDMDEYATLAMDVEYASTIIHELELQKYRYILDKVLIDKSDRVANKEIMQLMEYEKTLLNKAVNDSLLKLNKKRYNSERNE